MGVGPVVGLANFAVRLTQLLAFLPMRMRTREITIDIDLITNVVDIGELVKMATQLGFSAVVEPAGSGEGLSNSFVVRMMRGTRDWAETDVANLAMIWGYVNDKSGDQMLDSIRRQLVKRHFPLDRPIQDVMEIGAGPNHEGHEDH